MKQRRHNSHRSSDGVKRELVSLKTIAEMVDAHRSTVRRWLKVAGIKPIVVGRGQNGAIRYRSDDIRRWLQALESTD